MNILKSHFSYNKRQRNGIFFLIFIIVGLQIIYFLVDFSHQNSIHNNSTQVLSFLKETDSLNNIKNKVNKPQIFPFNPNFITDYKGYELGMSVAEIDKLHSFRASGAFINSAEEFQQVTGINDSLFNIISPYFKFPEWIQDKAKKQVNDKNHQTKSQIFDINKATIDDLKTIHGIGDKLAQRIIKYRDKLQGFTFEDQLYEVWYLDKEVANKVLAKFKIIDTPIINKLNINKASFKEVMQLPYLDYNLTKKIFEYKVEVAEIQSIEDLKKIDGFPLEKFNRIALYLQAN